MENLRHFKIRKSMGKLKDKFIVVPIWTQYRDIVPIGGNWQFDKFDTYEEAERFVKSQLKERVDKYIIMKIYGRFDCSYELKVKNTTPKNKYAVFAMDYEKLRYCGIIKGYDRKDVLDTLSQKLVNYNIRFTKVYLIKDGKIRNQTAVRKMFDKGWRIGTDSKKIFNVEFEDIPLSELR